MKRPLSAMLVALACSACVYKGAKITEGVDVSVGMNVPGSEGSLQLSFFNYLSGFRFALAQDSQLELTYNCWQTNSFLGLSQTVVHKEILATIVPNPEGAKQDKKAAKK